MYTIHYEYFENNEDHVNITKLSILTFVVGFVSLFLVFFINEIVHWQEIRYLNGIFLIILNV